VPDLSRVFEQWIVAMAVFLTCTLFLSSLADPVNVVKLTVLVLTALSLLFAACLRITRDRVLVLPWGAAPVAGILLAAALVASAVAAPAASMALVGTYGRNSGLLAYGAALVLFFVGLRVWTGSTAHVLVVALLASGVFTASYGFLQYIGIDSIAWNNPFNPIIASLGNPDFASAYLGICAPAALWGILTTSWSRPWRVASGATLALCLFDAGVSSAIQGPLAAASGLTVAAAAWFLNRGGAVGRRGLQGLAAVAAAGVAALAAGAAHVGPFARFFTGISWDARTWYWGAAIDMFRRKPLFGVGLDHYGVFWRQVRPAASTQQQGPDAFSDAAHSVPLQMLAQGGAALAAAYLLFTVVVIFALVRGMRRLDGAPRLLLGAIGGAWTAYFVQSVVSIDQVPLLTVQFATAAAILGVAGVPTRTLRLAGALAAPAPAPAGRRRQPQPIRRRARSGADYAFLAVAGIGLSILAWQALLPLRADAAARSGDVAAAAGNANAGLMSYRRATELRPGLGTYWGKLGQLQESAQQPQIALATYKRGIRHDPVDLFLLRKAGALADQEQDPDARSYLRRAVALDPSNPATVTQAANYATAHGEADWALSILASPLSVLPRESNLWEAAGRAYASAGNRARAKAAFTKALALNPALESAKTGLAALTPN
jgi:tetratricopeptide (TPR) repeat protein